MHPMHGGGKMNQSDQIDTELRRVLDAATELAGGDGDKARTWLQTQPLREFDGKTAEQAVRAGRAADVLRLIEIYGAGPAG